MSPPTIQLIEQLAATGHVRLFVANNFDRLIEQAQSPALPGVAAGNLFLVQIGIILFLLPTFLGA